MHPVCINNKISAGADTDQLRAHRKNKYLVALRTDGGRCLCIRGETIQCIRLDGQTACIHSFPCHVPNANRPGTSFIRTLQQRSRTVEATQVADLGHHSTQHVSSVGGRDHGTNTNVCSLLPMWPSRPLGGGISLWATRPPSTVCTRLCFQVCRGQDRGRSIPPAAQVVHHLWSGSRCPAWCVWILTFLVAVVISQKA